MPKRSRAGTLSADIVVIGCGGAGLAAAVTVATGGGRVIVLEKLGTVGGATNYAEGIFAVESSLQRSKGITLTRDEVFKRHMESGNWRANPLLVRAIIDKSADTVDWLKDMGVRFVGAVAYFPGGPEAWHVVDGLGAGIVKALLKRAKDLGVEICLKTPARNLLMRKGRVAGVVAEGQEGRALEITAPAVLIADGGFANNKALLAKYTTAGPNVIPFLETGKTGDGVQMAWKAGAAHEGEDVLMRAQPVIRTVKSLTPIAAVLDLPYLWVNRQGERFCDEGIVEQWPFPGHALANQIDQLMFHVFDEATKIYVRDHGLDLGLGTMIPPGTKIPDIDARLQRIIDDGEAWVADSIEELAVKMGVDAATLTTTVDTYNRYCDKKHDDLFAKDPKYLRPVRTPKFYAMRGYPSCMSTLGGIKINEKAEVVNTHGEVIPGLYAGGNCAGGFYGGHYHLVTTGGASAFALNSGRIAGESVLQRLGIQAAPTHGHPTSEGEAQTASI